MVLMLCEERLGVKSYTHVTEPQYRIQDSAIPGILADMDRLCAAEPLQYVLGCTEFYSRRFKVSPSVLIPRPETELLVDEAVRYLKTLPAPARVADLCTGSGCIAWSILLEVPGSEVLAVDLSDAALEVAGSQFDGTRRPEFIKADVLDTDSAAISGSFDLLVSNPPYVMEREKALMRPNVLEHEPAMALFVPDDDALVFYEALSIWAQRLLTPGGLAIFEINESLGEETLDIYRRAGYENLRIIRDLAGKSRFVSFTKPRQA